MRRATSRIGRQRGKAPLGNVPAASDPAEFFREQACHPGGNGLEFRKRPGPVETLAKVEAHQGGEVCEMVGLDPLGHGKHPSVRAELHEVAYKDRLRLFGKGAADESPVELHDIQGKGGCPRVVGIAGPKVIERYEAALSPELLDKFQMFLIRFAEVSFEQFQDYT